MDSIAVIPCAQGCCLFWVTAFACPWEGVGLPETLCNLPRLPRPSQKFPGNFPGTSLTVDVKRNPQVPHRFLRLLPTSNRTSIEVDHAPLGILTPSDDSQKTPPNLAVCLMVLL